MRHTPLLALIYLIGSSSLSNPSALRAQGLLTKIYPPTTWIGLRAGTSIASESLSEIRGGAFAGLTFGFTGGLDIEHRFDGKWALCTGVSFTQKGIDESYAPSMTEPFASGDDRYSMNFVEVPIHLKITAQGGDVLPFIRVGPTFGFLVSSSESTSGSLAPVSNLTSYLRSFCASLYFGSGVMYNLGGGSTLFFDAGYNTGLTNVFRSDPPRSSYTRTGQTIATSDEIIVMIGAMFQL